MTKNEINKLMEDPVVYETQRKIWVELMTGKRKKTFKEKYIEWFLRHEYFLNVFTVF